MEEPLGAYLEAFEGRQDAFENLLETTVDLTQLSGNALAKNAAHFPKRNQIDLPEGSNRALDRALTHR